MQNKVWAAGFAALLGMAALGQPVLAQVGGAGTTATQKPGAGRLKKMADALGLTDAQKAQIKPILKGQRQQVKAVQASITLTPAQKQVQIKSIRKVSGQQVMAVLTPGQKTKLAQLRRQRRNG